MWSKNFINRNIYILIILIIKNMNILKDKIDEKLLILLDKNPIMPISMIAKQLRISQQRAHFRIQRLITRGIITQFGTIINLKAIGLEQYRIFFSFNSHEDILKIKIFEYLKQYDGVYWAGRIGGKYDLTITLFVQNFEQFDLFIDRFNKKFSQLIKEYQSCYGINYYLYRHKYLGESQDIFTYGYTDTIQKIDDLDNYILQRIKNNARISSLEIAQNHKVSYKTIINRIKAMKSKKIILGHRLFIHDKIMQPAMLLISFRNYLLQTEQQLIAYLHKKTEVTQTIRLYGSWNLLIHLRTQNNEELQQFIINLRDKFDIIDSFEIIPIFEDIAIDLFPIKNNPL